MNFDILLNSLNQIFFVLRKKSNQISFLHCYHHAGMLIITYFHMRFSSGGGHGMVVGIGNMYVHVVMYCYYLATSLDLNVGKFWKKFITQIQLVRQPLLCSLALLIM